MFSMNYNLIPQGCRCSQIDKSGNIYVLCIDGVCRNKFSPPHLFFSKGQTLLLVPRWPSMGATIITDNNAYANTIFQYKNCSLLLQGNSLHQPNFIDRSSKFNF